MLTSLTQASSHKQPKEQQAASNGSLAADTNKQLFELIDSKFNRLAQKILDELRQSQQSQNFCQAIDAALEEPPTDRCPRKGALKRELGYNAPGQEQPRSLPVELRSAPPANQRARAKPGAVAAGKRYSPNELAAYPISKSATIGDPATKLAQQAGLAMFAGSITTHPLLGKAHGDQLHRPAGGHGQGDLDRDQCSRRKYSDTDTDHDDDNDGDDDDDDDDDQDDDQHPTHLFQESSPSEHCQSGWAASKTGQAGEKPVINSRTYSEVKNVTESNNNNIKTPKQQTYFKPQTVQQIVQKHQQNHQHQSLPATNNPSSQQQLQTRQYQRTQNNNSNSSSNSSSNNNNNNNRQRYNPIARSNTLGSVVKQQSRLEQHKCPSEDPHHGPMKTTIEQQLAKPTMMLNKRDIGSLYKPHMNYSTSVLGNHRLSDDDEIIIIPTQSPSLMSASPDVTEAPNPDSNLTNSGQAGLDDATERFSISRTKSFWEKLSKGRVGQRIGSEPSSTGDTDYLQSLAGGKQAANCLPNNQYQFNVHACNFSDRLSSLKSTDSKSGGAGGKKPDSFRQTTASVTRQTHNLDRMDSTGGSNSNYSCSSSGDENSGSHSQHNPVVGQIQEMSRQNRFRQTR